MSRGWMRWLKIINKQVDKIYHEDIQEAVSHGVFQFDTVGTPPDEDGAADFAICFGGGQIHSFENMEGIVFVVDKSTVPVVQPIKSRKQLLQCRHRVAFL